MRTEWWIEASSGPSFVLRLGALAARGSLEPDARLEPAERLKSNLRAWLARPESRRALLEVYAALGGVAASPARFQPYPMSEAVLRRLERAFDRGEVVAPLRRQASLPPDFSEAPAEAAPSAARVEEEHTLDFVFEYPDGSPAEGYAYQLVDPNGDKTPGKLGGDARIHRDDPILGGWSVTLKEVEKVLWEKRAIRCDDEVKVYASLFGFDDGARGKVRVFREAQEGDDDALDAVDVTVAGGCIETTWKYDYTKDDVRKEESGTLSLIAEASLEGGKYWGKTLRWALKVALKTLVSVRWVGDHVRDGETAEIDVKTRGFADGTEMKLELWARSVTGDEEKLFDLEPVKIVNDAATAQVPYAQAPEGEDDAPLNGAVRRAGEYFVRVTIEDNVLRSARSDLLWCDGGSANGGA